MPGNETAMLQGVKGRGVFLATLGAIDVDSEWMITVTLPGGVQLVAPASVRAQWQSVVMMPSQRLKAVQSGAGCL
jgi:hypothetical protein